ncbi:MAG: hypothetical protein KC589_07835 [Nanoarchaeota archaeon]|nr:hypothetical protein [Nanoarchaeota archaeon]
MTNENKVKTEDASAFGIDAQTAEKIRTDILPACPLGNVPVGESIKLRILSAKPEMVKHKQKDPKTKEEVEVETPVLKVNNLSSGMDETLWLSSQSLKQEMFKIYKAKEGNLENTEVLIKVEEYTHETFGKCRGYRSQVVKSEASDFGIKE